MTKAKSAPKKPTAAEKAANANAAELETAIGAMSAPAPAPRKAKTDDSHSMHNGLHDGHDSSAHFVGQMHDDQFPENWAPPSDMDAPEPRPNMVQRWIRHSLLGKADPKNLSTQSQSGWRPRALESVPEGDRKKYPTMKDARTAGEFMVNGDLILCEMPKRLFDQMGQHYEAKRRGQVNALVDAGLKRDVVPGGASHGIGDPYVDERSSSVRTRVPIVAADS